MNRGALYIIWPGEVDPEPILARSIDSLKIVHPELPYKVVTMPEGENLLCKSRMFDLSPFTETLFLDADTIVCGRLDFGFEMANRHGIACCICEAPYARRYGGLKNAGDLREFNTGVIFWNRTGYTVQGVFDRWKTLAQDLDSSILFEGENGRVRMPLNDQASFAAAIDRLKFNPCVLPQNWNLRPAWQNTVYGEIKIWHDYDTPSPDVIRWSIEQGKVGAVMGFATLKA